MNKLEVAKLLTAASAIDNRKIQDETVEAWYAVLHAYDYADCAEAVRQHFEESTEYLLPAHVRAGVRRVRELRSPSNDTTPDRFKQLASGEIQSAPKPANWDLMCAAWNDRAAFAREVAVYDRQLIAAGFPTVPRYDERKRAA